MKIPRGRRILFVLLLLCACVAAWARGRRFLLPFPEVADPSQVRIALVRSGCFGTCPSYEVAISGDGTVRYRGGRFVLVAGDHTAHIDPKAVTALLDSFRKAHFFGADDVYRYNVTDLPTYRMTVTVGSSKKTVVDYWGKKAGMPQELIDLEGLIDKTAGTMRWVAGSDETARALAQEGWRFGSSDPENIALYLRAIQSGNRPLVESFLQAGAPVDKKDPKDAVWPSRESIPICAASGNGDLPLVQRMYGQTTLPSNEVSNECLKSAARSGSVAILQFWIEHGARPSFPKEELDSDVLPAAIGSNNPEMVRRLLVDYKPDLHLIVDRDPLILWELGLFSLQSENRRQSNREITRLLLQYGAEVDARDDSGYTALIRNGFVESTVRELLAAGADPTAVAKNGDSALARAKQYRCPACAKLIEAALAKRAQAVSVTPAH